jgi:hypothetical protein
MTLTPALVAQTVHDRERMLAGIEHDIPADLAARIREQLDDDRTLMERLLPADTSEPTREDARAQALPDDYFTEAPFPDFV